ncbi:alpha/beta hydrolase fold domain-containing protein [Oceanobacillus sp. CFH 90083]|uniref:alpha/beta hydrolase fold domain-containing protein n=1 Tax=Oceanobacillus sp. CFH 90083 TaxID=2592336 RepID=UPI00128DDC1C|nr:alpha/beta hydrolase [Oceanobacillus sp. CFH 90083]
MRSVQSKIVERFLTRLGSKEKFTDEKRLAAFMEKKRAEKPYTLPKHIQKKYAIEKKNLNGMDCYIFNQENKSPEKQILYLHGGGYINQPLGYHWRFLGEIEKQTNTTIIVPIYPKAPNHQYQEAFAQVLPIYEAMLQHSEEKEIVLMGDSAGGGFALALAQLLLQKGLPQPRHIILLSPWLDITMKNPEAYELESKDPILGIYGLIQIGKAYAGDTDPNHYLLSPMNGQLRGLGEISLFIGTHEIFLPDARKFKEKAESQGVTINYYEYPEMNHIFPLFPIPEAKKATAEIGNIIHAAFESEKI